MSLANELRACLNEILRAPVPEPAEPDDPVRFFKQWLAERNLGLVPIADAAAFDWPGQWIAVVHDRVWSDPASSSHRTMRRGASGSSRTRQASDPRS